MEYTEKSIGFAHNLVPLVKSGEKVLTYRLGDKWNFLEVGDHILTDDSSTNEVFAELEIIGKEVGTFGTLRDDRDGHEVYESPEQRREVFRKYYNREVPDDETAIIFQFKVVRLINE